LFPLWTYFSICDHGGTRKITIAKALAIQVSDVCPTDSIWFALSRTTRSRVFDGDEESSNRRQADSGKSSNMTLYGTRLWTDLTLLADDHG
jgi:hypothetical protein